MLSSLFIIEDELQMLFSWCILVILRGKVHR
jgi:hypothetical protein